MACRSAYLGITASVTTTGSAGRIAAMLAGPGPCRSDGHMTPQVVRKQRQQFHQRYIRGVPEVYARRITAWRADRATARRTGVRPASRTASDRLGGTVHLASQPERSSPSPRPWPGGFRIPLRSSPASSRGMSRITAELTLRRLRIVPAAGDANADHVCSMFARMSRWCLVITGQSRGSVSRGCVIAGHVVA